MDGSILVTKRKSHRVSIDDIRAVLTLAKTCSLEFGISEDVVIRSMHMLELRRKNELTLADNDQTDRQVYDVGTTLEAIARSLNTIQKTVGVLAPKPQD